MAMYWMMVAGAVCVAVYWYHFTKRIMRFYGLNFSRRKSFIVRIILAAAAGLLCVNVWTTSAMVMLHIFAVSVGIDVIAFLMKKLCKNVKAGKFLLWCKRLYGCGIFPFFITLVMLVYGFVNMTQVMKTEYLVETDKAVGNYKLVLISDTHYATVQDTDILKGKIEIINDEDPDIVILGGDIVDEGTSKEKMQEVFQVLGGLESKYGIYYVYGNHDRQPYTDNRSFTDEELEGAITENGIRILEDEYAEIQDDLVIAGRGDAAWGNHSGRAASKEILEGVDRKKYIIVADHQPIEAEENDAQGVDLELSGHTHGGQIWPIGIAADFVGSMNYGEYQSGDCKVIVTSGFTGWGYPIRTERHCEYVVIDLKGKKEQ